MQAWELTYCLGERLADGMTTLGVSKGVVEEWHKGWGRRVLDPILKDASPDTVATEVVYGMRIAQILAKLADDD